MNSKPTRTQPSPARRAAFDILRRVETEGAYASNLITASRSNLSREDQSLMHEITLGVLRWQREIDQLIARYSKRQPTRLDVPVLIALRIGIYQLRHMSRVPESASVNESVKLVKSSGVASAAGMVNAVLRNAARHPDDNAADGIEDQLERVSVETSHPRWLLERWIAQFGEGSARRLALANNEPPHTAFRCNTLRSTVAQVLGTLESQGVNVRLSDFVPDAFVVVDGPARLPAQMAEQGLLYIQDEASQLVALMLGAQHGERVLDMCAAPGSKSSHIAALTADRAWVLACDIHPHRLATLFESSRRQGISSIDALACDTSRALPLSPATKGFDRVLLDAPCSGTGTLRRNPEIKWRLKYEDITRLAELQFALLTRAVEATAAGGRLVYSTCSIEPEENEHVVRRLIDSGAPVRLIEPEAGSGLMTTDGFVRTFPHLHGTDGFFVAVLEKVS